MDPLFGIYVHWPFCQSKCPYCDFNSHVHESVDQDRWKKALVAELDSYKEITEDKTVTSVFFGGGTPSLMDPKIVTAILNAIHARWEIAQDIEITLEANPTSVESEKFKAFYEAGVNRVSIGVQALDDESLKFLGRTHDVSQALRALDLAAEIFPRFSFDMMYGRPGQTPDDWERELLRALGYSGGHMSLYQLTIEKGTAFYTANERGDFAMPDEDLMAVFYGMTNSIMAQAGMPAYEVSNYAVPGEECRHNLTYWMYYDYLGVGPGAHGRLTKGDQKMAVHTHRAPDVWLSNVEECAESGRKEPEILTQKQRFIETLMMGLRIKGGVSRDTLVREGGPDWYDYISLDTLERFKEADFIRDENGCFVSTPKGRARLDTVIRDLIRV